MIPAIAVLKAVAEKKYAGELSFSFEPDPALLDIPYVTFGSPVRAELAYEIFEDDSVEVRGTLTFTLRGLCSRCLAEAEREIRSEAEGVFVTGKPKDDEYVYRGGTVELSEFLRDSVMFALPQRLLCGTCEEE